MFQRLAEDIHAIRARDPAARSAFMVLVCYPGLHAVTWHRLAHRFYRWGWHTPARMVAGFIRALTGIEIHPGAVLGRRLFIDHGMGIVVGETAIVGDDCTLYQGVTLGGTALERGKRHPTLEAGVIVGAGAKVLGPITVGAGARIGANSVVVKPVAPGQTVVGLPARPANPTPPTASMAEVGARFETYGIPTDGELPDPVARAIAALAEQVALLHARVTELETERSQAALAIIAREDPAGQPPQAAA